MSFVSVVNNPPASHELRPERADRVANLFERFGHSCYGRVKQLLAGQGLASIVARVDALTDHFSACSNEELRHEATELRVALHGADFTDSLVARSFALIREVAERSLGMRHYNSQLIGGYALLQGVVAEMETGEGKTLTATLVAGTVALAGVPVHVITVNDYLTNRDAEEMGPIYRALGLSVGCVIHGLSPQQRREAYACDITYVTNKEIVFDYLRDRLTLGDRVAAIRLQTEKLYLRGSQSKRLLLRGLHFALVDEADSILIDEARTPLIISGSSGGDEQRQFLEQALQLARGMEKERDYRIDLGRRQILLTDQGRQAINAATKELGSLWSGLVRREGTVNQALYALHLFKRDEQYLVRDGKVEIVDEFTGRVMADRSWEQGLHQLIEVKEECALTERREALAKISYQRFFRRYLRLSGMTGTAREVAKELWAVYHLPTVRVPTHRPIQRKILPDQILLTEEQKWQAIVTRIEEVHASGRPVLVGTRSVAASEHLSRRVSAAGLPHRVLNARQDKEEAQIISEAGERGQITIATNMAGRGTDIKLGSEVKKLGGLYVIASERHEAARIDRQLAGRGGRQGDSGDFEAILSLEDPLLEAGHEGLAGFAARQFFGLPKPLRLQLSRMAFKSAQKRVERYHAQIRKRLFHQDQQQGSLLSFSGRLE